MTNQAVPSNAARDVLFKPTVIAVVVALISFLVFLKSLKGDFVMWDDDINIQQNSMVHGLTASNVRRMFTDTDQAQRYKPLNWLGWAAIYQVCGLKPFGYHLANLLFHAANTALLFLLLTRLVRLRWTNREPSQPYLSFCCAIGALLWAVHPLRVEPVAWITGLPYGQSVFFMLVSLLCYLKQVTPQRAGPGGRAWYWASVLAFAVALFTYPIVIGLVFVLFVLDCYPVNRIVFTDRLWPKAVSNRVWLEKIPFVAIAAIFAALNLYARLHPSQSWTKPVSLEAFGPGSRVMQSFYIWANYLWKEFWPTDLSPYYLRLVNFQPTEMIFIFSAGLVILLTAFCYWQRRRCPLLLAVWTCYLALLVPMLGWTEHPHFASDRYSFIVAMGWSVLVVAGLLWLRGHGVRGLAGAAAALSLAAYAAASVNQIRIWQDTQNLCLYMASQLGDAPQAVRPHIRLGKFYMQKQDYARARDHLQRAARVNQPPPVVYPLLGETFVRLGQHTDAIEAYRRAVTFEPEKYDYHRMLTYLLCREDRPVEAARHYAEFVRGSGGRIAPDLQAALLQMLAASYAKAGHMQEALRQAETAWELARALNNTKLTRDLEAQREEFGKALAGYKQTVKP
jgi:cytochrome c-type biogenesis protein CcmH/NrfG